MSLGFAHFRTLSRWAYTFLFSAILGYTVFGYTVHDMATNTSHSGLLFVWIGFALVGSVLTGLKNRKILNSSVKGKIVFADLAVSLTLLFLSILLPTFLGLLRGAIVLSVMAAYMVFYFTLLDRGRLGTMGEQSRQLLEER